ncbi:Chaperone J-domain superfamily [Arabidopsis suecica]|uniref:Chaperone J-domain superfamily n=1 Tax=Arabidopsis suecica TaxID=45249 RepID=A0A8T2EGE2_ARASU|nr:Chaperone J-domain superfamily [Arabidopsis suecica]
MVTLTSYGVRLDFSPLIFREKKLKVTDSKAQCKKQEDYCESFSGFNGSSRAAVSSIPVLDLPLVGDRDVYFDVRSQGFDYREVFGGFNDLDLAPSYEELFLQQRSTVVGIRDSSDDAWTPEEVESCSGGTEHSGKSPCFSNVRDSYDSIDASTEFNISYNKASQISGGETNMSSSGVIRVADLGAIPGYTVAVDGTTKLKKVTGPSSVGRCTRRFVFEDKYYSSEPFVTVSEIGLKTHPTGIPPPSRAAPILKSDFRSSASNSKTTGSQGSADSSSSPPFFDVEVDANSAAVREAMKVFGSKSLSSQGSANSDGNDEWKEANNQYVELEEKNRRMREAREKAEHGRKMRVALEQEKERRIKEAREKEENERRIKEAREKAELEQRLKATLEQEEKERQIKERQEREENERRAKEVLEQAENERKLKEALEQKENERRLKETREKEENKKKLREAIELEEKEKRLIEAFERAEIERRLKEDLEQEEMRMRLQEAKERERLHRENQEHQENERKQHEYSGEESDEKERDACEMEKTCETTKEAHGEQSSNESLSDTLEENESIDNDVSVNKQKKEEEGTRQRESMSAETCPWKVFEKTLKDASQKEGTNEMDADTRLFERNEETPRLGENGGCNQQNGESGEESTSVTENIIGGKLEQKSKNSETSKDASVLKRVSGLKTEVEERLEDVVGVGRDQRNPEESKSAPKTSYGFRNHEYKFTHQQERGNIYETQAGLNQDAKVERPLPSRVSVQREKEAERLKRERDLEMEQLRKVEEEREREREREKDRMAFDQRALADARERLEKACAEAREKSLPDKLSMEARLRAERAAVERATSEARDRAAEKAAFEARERMERSVSDKQSQSSGFFGERMEISLSDKQFQNSVSFGASRYQDSHGTEGESPQRCTSRLERHQRTADRVAKALAEKNMRDLVAQREQAERIRIAETLDTEVKRWSSGKEGNIRALLSTLQYILGPESGWQPLPLTEVITSAAVKRAYRKATLCVHPDKLQQRGANIHQKYICEKVFDLLKEAWNRFNSEGR